jgi:uncharacterized membrane protein
MDKKVYIPRMQKLRHDFLTGIAVIFPIAITVYIFILIFRTADGILGGFINTYLNSHFGYKIPGIGIILMIIFVLERFIIKLPLLRHIYSPAKQLSNFLFKSNKNSAFNRVVLVPYPNDFTYSIGFMTNDELSEIDKKLEKKIVSVLVSTPPSPFSGPIIFIPREKVKILDLSMEEAIKFIVSGGLVAPERYLLKKDEALNCNI